MMLDYTRLGWFSVLTCLSLLNSTPRLLGLASLHDRQHHCRNLTMYMRSGLKICDRQPSCMPIQSWLLQSFWRFRLVIWQRSTLRAMRCFRLRIRARLFITRFIKQTFKFGWVDIIGLTKVSHITVWAICQFSGTKKTTREYQKRRQCQVTEMFS